MNLHLGAAHGIRKNPNTLVDPPIIASACAPLVPSPPTMIATTATILNAARALLAVTETTTTDIVLAAHVPTPQDKYIYEHDSYCSQCARSHHHDYEHYEWSRYHNRNRSPPPKRSRSCCPSPKLDISLPIPSLESFPDPPEGWSDQGYYSNTRCSYKQGGKVGRGSRKVEDLKTGKTAHNAMFLEQLTCEEKYTFIKAHHPFAALVGLKYFNPYSKVVIQAAVTNNLPQNADIALGKALTWVHFGGSSHKQSKHDATPLSPTPEPSSDDYQPSVADGNRVVNLYTMTIKVLAARPAGSISTRTRRRTNLEA
ncbi:hypothetical protein FRC11_014107 [Ceratobasidium sp. 423]|nr:hypothetical protein FRC11_014107 [Ceratobasidium sp. 423]